MSLYAERLGSGPELVLVHGWGLHGGIWAGLAQRLAQRFRVTVVDLPGHAGSRAELGCDRKLVRRAGKWIVQKLK